MSGSATFDTMGANIVKGSKNVIARFSFKSSRRGAIIFGLAAGGMISLQGLAFAATYTGELARSGFATTLASNPTLGILYGEIRNIETPAGYMVYRSLPFMAFLGAIWGLAVATRLLRGQEEDGRLELLLTGKDTLVSGMLHILKGIGASMVVGFTLSAIVLVLLGRFDDIRVSASASLFLAVALFSPAAVFIAIGAVLSQLAATRRRAMMYGAVLLVIFFVLRSLGNVIESLYWTKYFTPFGWVDKSHPVTGSDWVWLLPIAGLVIFCLTLAGYFAGHRDLGESIIADDETAKPRYSLLGGPFGLGFRLTRGALIGWALTTVGVAGLMASIAKTASEAVASSNSLTKAIENLAGSNNAIAVAFIGLGGFMIAVLLMLVIATGLGRVREDEAKGFADNFLVNSVSRTSWLVQRSLLLVMATAVICFLGNLTSHLSARAQGIDISGSTLLMGGFNLLGPALMMLGVGVLIFGIKPRLTSILLYTWIAWSFVIEMIGSVVTLSDAVIKTSLMRHISLVPGMQPDWKTFITISTIGLIAFAIGAALFARRDLANE